MVVCDELLVRFAPGATDAQMAAAVASVGGRIVGQLAGLDYFQLAVPSCDVAALRSARELLANDLSVSETSENGVRVPSQASNDP
jgi:hypothetical protein